LQRLQRIDQARAEIVVAVAGREPLRARGQDAANVGGRQLRVAFQHDIESVAEQQWAERSC
jgi:hypothetical protein